MDSLAALHNIHLRTGCFCNTGACQNHLGLSSQQIKENFQVLQLFLTRLPGVGGREVNKNGVLGGNFPNPDKVFVSEMLRYGSP